MRMRRTEPALTGEVQVLAQHVRRHERDALLGDAEAALAIRVFVFADNHAPLDDGAPVDDRLANPAAFADVDVRQDDGLSVTSLVGMHVATREQQRSIDRTRPR